MRPRYEVWIGVRGHDPGWYVGRPSPLGNPCASKPSEFAPVRVATKAEALAYYARWLPEQLADPRSPAAREFGKLLARLREAERLWVTCFCDRLRFATPRYPNCHADIIAGHLIAVAGGELIGPGQRSLF